MFSEITADNKYYYYLNTSLSANRLHLSNTGVIPNANVIIAKK